jgi:hypothetical protein
MPGRSKVPKLGSPQRIQQYLEQEIGYNLEPRGATCYSPALVLRHGVAHCMEGAMFAAAALRRIGFPALLVDLEAVRDSDHVLAVYKRNGCWGSLAKSNYSGLRGREPVYRTIRELAMSYFDHYCNDYGEKTLRTYSTRPVNLARFDDIQWMTTEEEVWEIPSYLVEIPHTRLLSPTQERQLMRMSPIVFDANYVGHQLRRGAAIRITPRPPRH